MFKFFDPKLTYGAINTTFCVLCCLVLTYFFLSNSDTVQYQTIYSGGNGLVFVLGLVPNSHIVIVEYKIEDGEIMNKVLLSVWNSI